MTAKRDRKLVRFVRDKAMDDLERGASTTPGLRRTVLQRAGLLYLGLFLGLSTLLSLAGVDPLFHNGALPKFLLLYVGLATLVALGNGETNLMDEQARSWLALFRYRPSDRRSDKGEERF